MVRSAQRLSAQDVSRWRRRDVTTAGAGWEPGALLGGPTPHVPGWHRLGSSAPLAPGQWESAGRALLGWQAQLGSGIGVRAEADPLVVGSVAVLRIGPLRAPVRVLAVRQEPDLVGFCYGTLPGHPEVGEEAFWVERVDGVVTAHVSALSRGGAWYTRAAGPVGRLAQHVAARRYLAVLAAQPSSGPTDQRPT